MKAPKQGRKEGLALKRQEEWERAILPFYCRRRNELPPGLVAMLAGSMMSGQVFVSRCSELYTY